GRPHRGPIPPLVLRADPGTGLRVRFDEAPPVVETGLPGTVRPEETLLVPLGALGRATRLVAGLRARDARPPSPRMGAGAGRGRPASPGDGPAGSGRLL